MLKVNIKIIHLICIFLKKILPFFPYKGHKGDVILFPYTQKGSDGYLRRFEEYFVYFENKNIDYKVCHLFEDDIILKERFGHNFQRYRLYRKIAWKRLFQIIQARKYKAVFIHRGLFPYYPDLKDPFFEPLLRKINSNITIDFWDSVWHYSGHDLIQNTVRHCDKITVVNDHLYQYFQFSSAKKFIYPIAVNVDRYQTKINFELAKPIKLFYTGGPGNVKQFLKLIHPVLLSVNKKFELHIVSSGKFYSPDYPIVNYEFEESTFFEIMKTCDIGIYKVRSDDESKGKMAMKVLDYLSTGLPVICSKDGISPFIKNNHDAIIVSDEHDWNSKLELLLSDIQLRKKLGFNSIQMVRKNHNLDDSFKNLLKILEI